MASRSCGSTTRKNTPAESEPSARADSSTAGSSRRSVAAAGRYMNGKYDSVVDQDTRPQPVQRGDHADPGVAVDERRNGQRRNEQRTPECPARKVGPLDQPGDTDTDDDTERHRDDDQRDGVEQQLADPRPDDEFVDPVHPIDTPDQATYPSGMNVAATRIATVAADERAGTGGRFRPRNRAAGRETGRERPPTASPPSSSDRSPSARRASRDRLWAPAGVERAARRGSRAHRWPPGTRTRCPSRSTSWPALPVTNFMNCCAWSCFLLDLSTPPPDRLTNAPGSSF